MTQAAAQPKPPIPRRRFTVDEYRRMGETGILAPDERVELLDGEVIFVTPIGNRHAATVDRLTRMFIQLLGDDVSLRPQGPVEINHYTEPGPDITLLKPDPRCYADRRPKPDDILLIVEVSDTTLRTDQQVKLPLYAGAGIAEVWIVDINNKLVLIHRDPVDAAYKSVTEHRAGDSIAPRAFPDRSLAVADFMV